MGDGDPPPDAAACERPQQRRHNGVLRHAPSLQLARGRALPLTVRQEAYALIPGLKTFHRYIMGWPILAQVAHRSLLYSEELNSGTILRR